MQNTVSEIVKDTSPLFESDTIVFGVLMIVLGLIFFTSAKKTGIWSKFYKIVPALFMAYFIPALLTTFGVISPDWTSVAVTGEAIEHSSNLYYISSRYLLPAALVLMTLSIDLKAVFNLGPKALIMFLTGTAGIIIGGPIAVLLIGTFFPEAVGGDGADAVWRGLSTLAGSWIGGGANQTAMLEIYGYNQELYGGMVFVDIAVANIWMAVILIGIGKTAKIDKWLGADTSAIESLKEKMSTYAKKV
ncbi:MAG: putative membrane protein, partial [Parvicella sp.]